MKPSERYQQDTKQHGYSTDPVQQLAMQRLDLLHEVLHQPRQTPGIFKRLFSSNKVTPTCGLYLWGDTGRGKTYLMDTFYACLEINEKHRIHFHRFMRDLHHRMQALDHADNPIKKICTDLATQIRILCLDEFHVTDITDAMIMKQLLTGLFESGITLVTTSNIAIDNLYRNGLQREQFLPAIQLLHLHLDELELETGQDYRKQILGNSDNYFICNAPEGEKNLRALFERLASVPPKNDRQISINQRSINYKAWANDIIWFDFQTLCNSARSANDYIDIGRSFTTVFINHLPVMSDEQNNVAKRFILLIDSLYDSRTRVMLCADVDVDQLYTGRQLNFEFQRTISRLCEMRDQHYPSNE